MQHAAEILDVNVSTISRAVQNKYIQFEGQLYPLRDLFSVAIHADEHSPISSQAVRSRIHFLILHEDKTAPLSDEEIRLLLANDGVSITRRTVAGHRNALGIPFANRRKTNASDL